MVSGRHFYHGDKLILGGHAGSALWIRNHDTTVEDINVEDINYIPL